MENILVKMAQIKDLSPSERHVVDYILEHYRDVCNMGIVEVADHTFTSTTTVKRLCRKLGVNSYTNFRVLLSAARDDFTYRERVLGREPVLLLNRYDSVGEVLEKVSQHNASSILETVKRVDPQVLEKTVALMAQARRIDFYGVGPSYVVALEARSKCMRLKIPSTAFSDRVSMLTNAGAYTEGALAFLISSAGEPDDLVELAEVLRRNQVPTVAVITAGIDTLSGVCQYTLCIGGGDGPQDLGVMSSRIAAMNVIDVLFTALRNTNYERYTNYMADTFVNSRGAANT